MYIYNITTNIEESVAEEWLKWMETIFIPKMLKNNKLKKAVLTKVLITEDMGGVTYSTQYFCDSAQELKDFIDNDLDSIKNQNQKFTGKFVDFSTQLKVIKEL